MAGKKLVEQALKASVLFRRNREEGGMVEDQGFDKGGAVKKALKAVADLFETPEMSRWRGKSVIPSASVEDRYFHGTSKDKDFDRFNVGRHGVWLTKDPKEASQYAIENDSMGYKMGPGWNYEKTNTASRVIPVFARAENPHTGPIPDFALAQNYKRAQSDWFDQLRSQGHDAWLPENNPDLAVILRDPEQIKSAISNTGDFTGPRIDREDGGMVEDQGFDKGGSVVKKAIELSRRVMGYSDPLSKKIDDWKWRPLPDVATELDVQKIPPHVQQFGDYMLEMADKAKRGEISDRDLIKAYTTTRASIQRRSQDTDKIREASGLPLVGAEDKIRPEGAWAEWLMSPAGQRYLDKAVKGEMPEDTVESALSLMRSFGLAPTQINAMDWAAKNLPGRGQAASDLVYRASQKASPASEWRNFTSDVAGVGSAKSGFLASLLGRGDLPTLDARQVVLNTGLPTEASQKVMARSYQGQKGFGAQEGVDRLAARQEALGLEAPAKYDPFYQHLTHHTIWDKASNEKTTHADIINAMRNAAIVLGVPAAGAAVMPEEQPVERASGGRLLEDQYPTHYLPNVGRQVMQDGGVPDDFVSAQGRRRATLDELGAFEDRPVMDPETMGQNWASAVQRFRDKPLREGETVARPLELGGRDVLGGAIAGDGGIVRSRIADIVAGSRGLPGSGTVGFGAADFTPAGIPLAISDMSDAIRNEDYTSAALTAALPAAFYARKPIMAAGRAAYDAGRRAVDVAGDVLGRVPAPIAAGAAGAAAMTPEEAEAAKLRVPAGVTQILSGTPENAALNARAALNRVVSPFSEDPASVKRALEIAATYRVPQGAEFGSGSFFRKKPSMGVQDVQPDIAPLPGANPRAPRPLSWEEFGKEAKGGTLINVGGDRLNLGMLRDINNDKRMAWEVPLHAGPKYMLEPNPGLVWANAPGHTTSFNNIIADAAKRGPVYGVYAPMGPTAVDSSVGMFDAVMSQIPPAKITRAAAKEFDDMVRSGAFTQKVTDRPRTAEAMAEIWPGIAKLKDQSAVLALANKMTGTQRSDLIKAMEASAWRKKGFPEVGVTRVAVTDPALLGTPTNTIGHRVVRFDTEGKVSPTRTFEHQTYPTESLGQYVADVPLVQTQYGMPTAMEKLLSKPTKSGEIMHPYSLDPMGRSSARKMFTEQKQLQPVDDQLIESIMMGLQRQKEYGFKRGGSVSHYAMMIAKQLGSSPRETV